MTSQPDMLAPTARPTAAYLDALNPEQRAAVEAPDGPLLVLAGAGTGKTRVLTTRLAHMLATGRARPYQVLAVTFTNKAAREMTQRVAALLGQSVEGLWLGTFHALGARLLRRHAELVGLKPNFTILDTDDQLRLLKQVIEEADLDPRRFAPRALLSIIERFKDRGQSPDQVPESDIGDFARFPRPKHVSGFLGIVPSEHTSDTKRRQGAITKAGPGHARRLLVEAAWHYRHRPAIGVTLARRQAGQDPRAIAVAWRAQQRVHQRYHDLAQRRKPSGVITIACARELAAFCWEAATLD